MTTKEYLRSMFTPRFIKDLILSSIILSSLYALTHNPIVRPMSTTKPGMWSIELMQHPLVFGLAGHNYLVLRDSDRKIVRELHGLATDKEKGTWKYIGAKDTDILQVWEFDKPRNYEAEKRFPGIVLSEGSEQSMYGLWNQALVCKDEINTKKLSYPSFGFSVRKETENSNSVAYTLATCMGTNIKHLGLFTPGEATDLLKN